MAFDPLSLLILKFRGRSVAVFRSLCIDYDVSRSVFLHWDICTADHRKQEYHYRRTTQLATLAVPCSKHQRCHPPRINPRLSRHERGRTDQRGLADRKLRRSLRDHHSRIWCVVVPKMFKYSSSSWLTANPFSFPQKYNRRTPSRIAALRSSPLLTTCDQHLLQRLPGQYGYHSPPDRWFESPSSTCSRHPAFRT